MKRIPLLFLILVLFPIRVFAMGCTDGVDCLCDKFGDPAHPSYVSNLLLCEDFEDPNISNGPAVTGGQNGWNDSYGVGSSGCIYNPNPGTGTAYTTFGKTDNDCVEISTEGDCEVSGETDCVFDGAQSLGFRSVQGKTGGFVSARKDFTVSANIGFVSAFKWSTNYVHPGDSSPPCPAEGCGAAHKMNEWGGGIQPLMGSATVQAGITRNNPWGGAIFTDVVNAGNCTATVGQVTCPATESRTRIAPDITRYHFGSTNPGPELGEWVCLRMYYQNWGTATTSFTYWWGDTIIIQGTADTTQMFNDRDESGIGAFQWGNYYNGNPNGSGYESTFGTTAYRWEDNVVITDGEPPTCDAIGFGAAPEVPAPDASEGVNFGSGVNISSILPWFGDSHLEQAIFGGK